VPDAHIFLALLQDGMVAAREDVMDIVVHMEQHQRINDVDICSNITCACSCTFTRYVRTLAFEYL
jgi:hypothetical protein